MAFADWNITGIVTPSPHRLIASGKPIPESFGGMYCAFLARGARLDVKSSFGGGTLFNIPSTKSIRAQACLRRVIDSASGAVYAGVSVKNKGVPNNAGYAVASATDNSIVGTFNDGSIVALQGMPIIASGDWLNMRLDVFPEVGGDRLFYYQEVPIGSGIWAERTVGANPPGTGFFIATANPRYALWEDNRTCCVVNDLGLVAGSLRIYADKVFFQVAAAP